MGEPNPIDQMTDPTGVPEPGDRLPPPKTVQTVAGPQAARPSPEAAHLKAMSTMFGSKGHGGQALTSENLYEGFAASPTGQYYMGALGPKATAQQAAQHAMRDYLRKRVESSPELAQADYFAMAKRFGDQPELETFFREQAQPISEAMRQHTAKWKPEQWSEYGERLFDEQLPAEFNNITSKLAKAAGVSRFQMLSDYAAGKVTDLTKQVDKGLQTMIQQNPEGTGFTDWLTSNWQNFLIPGGIALALFGGNVGKVIGALAMGAGGWNLYQRYKNISGESPTSKLVQKAALETLRYHHPESGQHMPMANMSNVVDKYTKQYGPEAGSAIRQGILDMSVLARAGFSRQLIEGVLGRGQQVVEGMFGPGASQQVFGEYRAGLPSTVSNLQAAGGRAWESAKNMAAQIPDAAAQVWNRGRDWVSNAF